MSETLSPPRASEKQHWARFWKRERSTGEIYDNDDRILQETTSRFPVDGLLVLEVGAATARDSLSLAAEGACPVALDYIPEALSRARESSGALGRELLLVCGDAESLPFANGCFDMVFHQGVLEHFRDPMPLLLENARVLREGGLLLVDVPQTLHIYTLFKKVLIALNHWFAGWETQFTRPQLEHLLQRAGLRPTGAYGRFFSPSLLYRVLREAARAVGVRLPLRPVILAPVHSLRARVRRAVEKRLGCRLGGVLGVFATKERESRPA